MEVISAKVISDSVSSSGIRLITVQTKSPKFLDAEIEKHRMISTNSSSDRAIPVQKMVERPVYYPGDIRKNQPGMQGYEKLSNAEVSNYNNGLSVIINKIKEFNLKWADLVHKQTLNRNLLGWSLQDKVMTATEEEWDYFFGLRMNESADPAIQLLSKEINFAIKASSPILLHEEDWHLPYIVEEDECLSLEDRKKCSVARCARVSYLNHDKSIPDKTKDLVLFGALKTSKHWSCFEHIATPMKNTISNTSEYLEDGCTHITSVGKKYSGNFYGWIQYRKLLDN